MQNDRKYNLKALRAIHNLTQVEAGDRVGVSGDVWGRWERGESFPDVPRILAIEETFDVSYNEIIFLVNSTV